MIRKILGLPALFLLTFAYSYSPSIYVLCEGVWGENNGSLWSIGDGEVNEEFNMIGDVEHISSSMTFTGSVNRVTDYSDIKYFKNREIRNIGEGFEYDSGISNCNVPNPACVAACCCTA